MRFHPVGTRPLLERGLSVGDGHQVVRPLCFNGHASLSVAQMNLKN